MDGGVLAGLDHKRTSVLEGVEAGRKTSAAHVYIRLHHDVLRDVVTAAM